MTELQFLKNIWGYMLEEGNVTTGEWSYYGGGWETIPPYDYNKTGITEIREKLKTVSVDWGKTTHPESSEHDGFEGTFSPSSRSETLLGTMYLTDGSSYQIGVSDSSMGSYIETYKNLVNTNKLGEKYFGE